MNTPIQESKKKITEMFDLILQLRQKVDDEINSLEKKIEHLEKEVNEREQKTKTDIVKLNVGGKKFATSKTTLTMYENSMLSSMFSGQYELAKDDEGNVFIDRDGALFK